MYRHLLAVLMLPFTVIVLVPALLVSATRTFNPAWGLSPPALFGPVAAGIFLIASGLLLLVMTVQLFITIGRGTLAPWNPTQRLVVSGVYRYVRNPMISGVGAVLLGETLLLGSFPVLIWTLAFVVANLLYIPLSEEPGLRRRFGAAYETYTQHVPRWLPRRTPWQPPTE